MNELLKPIDAAKLAGVSYPTLKQWIYKGKIKTTNTGEKGKIGKFFERIW